MHRRTPSRAAMLSLLVALVSAAVIFAAWRWWQPAPTVPVYQRTIQDVELTWKCEAGHLFTAPGQVADRLCAMCDQPAYPITRYECSQHGAIDVAVRFTAGPNGAPKISQLRVNPGPWLPATDPARCPRCDAPMVRMQVDPLEGFNRTRKKTGG